MQNASNTNTWHIGKWGLWGWIETVLKLVAIGFAFIAFLNSQRVETMTLSGNPRLAAVILLILFSLLYLAVTVMRIMQKEIISIVFAILNLLGHLALLVALLRSPSEQLYPLLFTGFYVLGNFAKFIFLQQSGYTEAGQSSGGMARFNVIHTLAYLALGLSILI